MTAHEDIYLNTDQDLKPVVDLFASHLSDHKSLINISSPDKGEKYRINLPSFLVDCGKTTHNNYARSGLASYGFIPTIRLNFLPSTEPLRELMRDLIIKSSVQVMNATQWDIAIEFQNGDFAILTRVSGQLTLYNWHGLWTDQRLAFVTIPYSIVSSYLNE